MNVKRAPEQIRRPFQVAQHHALERENFGGKLVQSMDIDICCGKRDSVEPLCSAASFCPFACTYANLRVYAVDGEAVHVCKRFAIRLQRPVDTNLTMTNQQRECFFALLLVRAVSNGECYAARAGQAIKNSR